MYQPVPYSLEPVPVFFADEFGPQVSRQALVVGVFKFAEKEGIGANEPAVGIKFSPYEILVNGFLEGQKTLRLACSFSWWLAVPPCSAAFPPHVRSEPGFVPSILQGALQFSGWSLQPRG